MDIFIEIYRTQGYMGLIIFLMLLSAAGTMILMYLYMRSYIRQMNVRIDKDALEVNAVATLIAREKDSTTDLRVQIAAVNILRDDKAKLQHELDKCHETLTAAAYTETECRTQVLRLQQELQLVRAERDTLRSEMKEAHEALFSMNKELVELRKGQP